jgi:hypothetical protein
MVIPFLYPANDPWFSVVFEQRLPLSTLSLAEQVIARSSRLVPGK